MARKHADDVEDISYEGAPEARPAPGVLETLAAADAIILAPSNPYLSIGPTLAVREIGEALGLGVSDALPSVRSSGARQSQATRPYALPHGWGTTPGDLAGCYDGLIDALVIDESDAPAVARVELVTKTLMHDRESAQELARTVLEAACG